MMEKNITWAIAAAVREWATADGHGIRSAGTSANGFGYLQLHHRPDPRRPEQQLTLQARLVDGRAVIEVTLPAAALDSVRAAATERTAQASETREFGGTEPPLRDTLAHCEACGTRGTVGLAVRFDDANEPFEVHRFCATCWPEQSARYQARWAEEVRVAMEARRADATVTLPPTSTMFGAATWHGTQAFVRDLEQRMQPSPLPAREDLERIAAELARLAPTLDGPMPDEVAAFIRRYRATAS